MMRLRILTLVMLMLISWLAMAHEFWLQPDKFIYKVGETMIANFKVGENFMGEPWVTKKDKVEKLEWHHLENIKDLKGNLKENPENNLTYTLAEEGTQLFVMQSKSKFIELEAEKFNAYLKEDGLDDAYDAREKNNQLDKPGRENYTRYTKLLIQSGGKRDDTYKKIVGFPIEIIPEKNPYTYKVGDLVKYTILFSGKPLFGAKVVIWNREDNRTTIQPVYTMQDGTIEARISNHGMWMVSVVKMVPSKDTTADWQSYWGSLVFGVL